MRIAVVIPALQEASCIAAAIHSAQVHSAQVSAENAVQGSEVEIIVADGGSRDGTSERARLAGARVVPSEPGRACQLAAGLRASRAPVVLFLHADTRLPAGWDTAVREALADPAVAGGAFGLRFDERRLSLRLVEWGVRLRLAVARLPYGDQAIFARRTVLDALGGIPQQPIMEDLDLVRGIRRQGRLALLRPRVVTSGRRYRQRGVWRTVLRNGAALLAFGLGLDRQRVAAWYRR